MNAGVSGGGGASSTSANGYTNSNGDSSTSNDTSSSDVSGSDAGGSAYVMGGSPSASGSVGGSDADVDQISVALVRPAESDAPGMVSVSVPEEMVTSGKAFSFPLPSGVVEAAAGRKLQVATLDGKRLPSWLRYSPSSKSFSANLVPAGGLPIKLLVTSGVLRWTLQIAERKGH
jgi:hypothetical protein